MKKGITAHPANSDKNLIIRIVSYLFIAMLSLSQGFSQNLVNNGSFETYYTLPEICDTCSRWYDKDYSGTLTSKNQKYNNYYIYCIYWVNKSIGGCDNPLMSVDPAPGNCNGWYSPTLGSADYYNTECVESVAPHAKAPYVKPHIFIKDGVEQIEGGSENRYPFDYSENNHTKAYCGIIFNYLNYREYLQAKLNTAMEQDHCYHVSFRVSLSKSLGCSGYVRKIEAYFSNSPVIMNDDNDANRFWALHTGMIKTNNEYYVIPQLKCDKELNQTADANGYGGWDIIEGDVIVPHGQNWNYITIGNYEKIMSFTRKPEVTDLFKYDQSYYFIDSVNVIPTTCETGGCGNDSKAGDPKPWILKIDPSENQTDPNKCCYQCTLRVTPKDGICNVYRLTISNQVNGNWVQKYYHDGYITPNEDFIFSFCIDKNEGLAKKHILIEYNKDLTCYCKEETDLTCVCSCTQLVALEDYMIVPKLENLHLIEVSKIPYRNKNGQCCYDVFLNNNSDCHYPFSTFKYLAIESTSGEQPIYSGVTLTGQNGWTVRTDVYDGKTIKGFERPAGNTNIYPHTKIKIGTICISADVRFPKPFPSLSLGIRTFKVVLSSLLPTEGNFYLYNCTTDDIILTCVSWFGITCADFIDADLNIPAFSPDFSHGCFYELRYQQVDNVDYNCDIYKIKVFQPNDSINPFWTYEQPDTLYPLQPIYEWKPLLLLGINLPDTSGFSYNVGFYGLNDTLLCMKHVEAYCDPADTIISGDMVMPKIDLLNQESQLLYNPLIYPNPVEDEFTVKFGLLDNKFVKIDVLNELGEKVMNVFEGELNKGKFYEYNMKLNCCGNGNYFVRIIYGNSVKMLPFILLK